MVTIADVAREAQVSRSTASYALSNKRSVSPEVRRTVKEAAQRLGFTQRRCQGPGHPGRW